MHKIWENRPPAPTPRWPWFTAPFTYEGRKEGGSVKKIGNYLPKLRTQTPTEGNRRAPKSMPYKLTKPLNVYSNFIEQTSNRNYAFVVTPQHINNSLEFEALKTNISRKKIHKSKKKKNRERYRWSRDPEWKKYLWSCQCPNPAPDN